MRALTNWSVCFTASLADASWFTLTWVKGSVQIPVAGHTRIADAAAEEIREDGVPATIVEVLIADLAKRIEVDRSVVAVIRVEPVVWSNGALGCPKPGHSYTQVISEGCRVILQYEEKNYHYHCDTKGLFLLCDGRNSNSAHKRPDFNR